MAHDDLSDFLNSEVGADAAAHRAANAVSRPATAAVDDIFANVSLPSAEEMAAWEKAAALPDDLMALLSDGPSAAAPQAAKAASRPAAAAANIFANVPSAEELAKMVTAAELPADLQALLDEASAPRAPAAVAAAAPRSPPMVQPLLAPFGGPPIDISASKIAADAPRIASANAGANMGGGIRMQRAQRRGVGAGPAATGARPGIAPVPSPPPVNGPTAGGRSLAAELFGYGTGGQLSQTHGEIKSLWGDRSAYRQNKLQPLKDSLAEARAAKMGVAEAEGALRSARRAAPSFWGEGAKSLGNFFGASDLAGAGGMRAGAGAARIGAAVFGAGLAMKTLGVAADWIFD